MRSSTVREKVRIGNRHFIGLASGTSAPALRVLAFSLPAGIIGTGATPKRGGRRCLTACRTPPLPCAAPAAKKGGSLPVLPFPAGAARAGRVVAGKRRRGNKIGKWVMPHRRAESCRTPPYVSGVNLPGPSPDPGSRPQRYKYGLPVCASQVRIRQPQTARYPRLVSCRSRLRLYPPIWEGFPIQSTDLRFLGLRRT